MFETQPAQKCLIEFSFFLFFLYFYENVFDFEIQTYRKQFQSSNEGFIKNWPSDYTLFGWLISMDSGGELRPHMHERGWISGSIYINVPIKKNSSDDGNLVVCIDENSALTDDEERLKKTIDVYTGALCLFPASLLHYTIPFKSDEKRIVFAFDLVPKDYNDW